jgi:hypothetical protein
VNGGARRYSYECIFVTLHVQCTYITPVWELEETHIQYNNTFSPAPAWTGGKSILFLTKERRMEK